MLGQNRALISTDLGGGMPGLNYYYYYFSQEKFHMYFF